MEPLDQLNWSSQLTECLQEDDCDWLVGILVGQHAGDPNESAETTATWYICVVDIWEELSLHHTVWDGLHAAAPEYEYEE